MKIQNFLEAVICETEKKQTITIIKDGRNFNPLKRCNKVFISEEDFKKLCEKMGYRKLHSISCQSNTNSERSKADEIY